MPNLRFYVGLIRMLTDSSEQLELQSMTESDRLIYMILWELVDPSSMVVEATYDQIHKKAKQLNQDFSRPQFFKTMRILIQLGLISKVGPARSAQYLLHDERKTS